MIKGAKKQMIVVRTSESRFFDEAYFVLRREIPENNSASEDILKEADRLLSEAVTSGTRPKKHACKRWIFFAAGSLCGAIVAALTVCLLLLS